LLPQIEKAIDHFFSQTHAEIRDIKLKCPPTHAGER